jgi:hypothetical protein
VCREEPLRNQVGSTPDRALDITAYLPISAATLMMALERAEVPEARAV